MKLKEVSQEIVVRGDGFITHTVILAPELESLRDRNVEIDESIRAAGHSDGFWKGFLLATAIAVLTVWIFR